MSLFVPRTTALQSPEQITESSRQLSAAITILGENRFHALRSQFFSEWDRSDTLHLGLRYGDPELALPVAPKPENSDPRVEPRTIGRVPAEEIITNLAHGYFTLAHPKYLSWHAHDYKYHVDGMFAIAHSSVLSSTYIYGARIVSAIEHSLETGNVNKRKLLAAKYIRSSVRRTLLKSVEMTTYQVDQSAVPVGSPAYSNKVRRSELLDSTLITARENKQFRDLVMKVQTYSSIIDHGKSDSTN